MGLGSLGLEWHMTFPSKTDISTYQLAALEWFSMPLQYLEMEARRLYIG
jgi:hypothetical protein